MATLVPLTPACLVSDGTSVYAFSIGATATEAITSKSDDIHYVLAKSNPNPKPDLSDLTWSVVSIKKVEGDLNDLDTIDGKPSQACHIDPDTKTFTILSARSRIDRKGANSKGGIRGIQFQPNEGSGKWLNVAVDTGFEWKETLFSYLSTTLYKPKDSQSLMFATADQKTGKLWAGTMDPSTLVFKQSVIPWAYSIETLGEIQQMEFINNNLNLLSMKVFNSNLTSVPITGTTLSATEITSVDTTVVRSACGQISGARMFPLGNSIIFVCKPPLELKIRVFSYDGKTFTSLSDSPMKAQPSEAHMVVPGATPFVLLPVPSGTYSIAISGPNAGTWYEAERIKIPKTAFDNLAPSGGGSGGSGSNGSNGSSGSGNSDNSGSSGGGSNTGVIVGVICAVVVVIAAVGFVVYRKRATKKKELSSTAA